METAGERDGAWRKKTVNEAFLGSSKGLSRKGGKKKEYLGLFFFSSQMTSLERLREI